MTSGVIESVLPTIVHIGARIIELLGVTIIAAGALVTLGIFLVRLARGMDFESAVASFRSRLGRSILLGLEFLVAADIINTITIEPTLTSVAVLGGIVLIRTFLSFSLEAEIEGQWPWQRGGTKQRSQTSG